MVNRWRILAPTSPEPAFWLGSALAFHNVSVTRRKFIKLGSVVAAGTLLSACSGENNLDTPAPQVEPIEQLLQAVEKLPQSPIKKLLSTYGVTLFTSQDTHIQIDDLTLPLVPPQVEIKTITQTNPVVKGTYYLRHGEAGPKNYPNIETVIQFPLFDLLTPENIASLEQENPSQILDHQPLLNITYHTDVPIYSGIAPVILIEAPVYTPDRAELYEQIIALILIKELAGAALEQFYLTKAIHFMNSHNLPTEITTSKGKLEIVSQTLTNINNHQGRLLALFDIGAMVATVNACYGNIDQEKLITGQPAWTDIAKEIWSIRWGETSDEIMANIFSWIIHNPEKATVFPHSGDLKLVP